MHVVPLNAKTDDCVHLLGSRKPAREHSKTAAENGGDSLHLLNHLPH